MELASSFFRSISGLGRAGRRVVVGDGGSGSPYAAWLAAAAGPGRADGRSGCGVMIAEFEAVKTAVVQLMLAGQPCDLVSLVMSNPGRDRTPGDRRH